MTERPLCSRCRHRPAAPNRKRCSVCAEAERASDAKRRASAWCADCRVAKRVRGKTRCAKCAETRRVAAKKLADKRRKAGLCLTCGEEAAEGHAYCQRHVEYFRERAVGA